MQYSYYMLSVYNACRAMIGLISSHYMQPGCAVITKSFWLKTESPFFAAVGGISCQQLPDSGLHAVHAVDGSRSVVRSRVHSARWTDSRNQAVEWPGEPIQNPLANH